MVDDNSHIDDLFEERFSGYEDNSYKPEHWHLVERGLDAASKATVTATPIGVNATSRFNFNRIFSGLVTVGALFIGAFSFLVMTSDLNEGTRMKDSGELASVYNDKSPTSFEEKSSIEKAGFSIEPISYEAKKVGNGNIAEAPVTNSASKAFNVPAHSAPGSSITATKDGIQSNHKKSSKPTGTARKYFASMNLLSVARSEFSITRSNKVINYHNLVVDESNILVATAEPKIVSHKKEAGVLKSPSISEQPTSDLKLQDADQAVDSDSSLASNTTEEMASAATPSAVAEIGKGWLGKSKFYAIGGINTAYGFNNNGEQGKLSLMPNLGIGYEFVATNQYSILVEGYLVRRGGHNLIHSSSQTNYVLAPETTTQYVSTNAIDYIHLPVSFAYRVSESHSLSAGLYSSFLLNTVNERWNTVETPYSYSEERLGKTNGYKDGINSFSYGLTLGYTYSFKESDNAIGIRYNQGLSDITDNKFFNEGTQVSNKDIPNEFQVYFRLRIF